MGTISHPTDFFHFFASHQTQITPDVTDPLEIAILASQKRDAAIMRKAFGWLFRTLTANEDRTGDRLEAAVLACQRRDAATLRHTFGALHSAS